MNMPEPSPKKEYVPRNPAVRALYGILKDADIPDDKQARRAMHAQKYLDRHRAAVERELLERGQDIRPLE